MPSQILSILAASIFSYIWVTSPQLEPYSAQLAAGVVLFYFIVKYINQAFKSKHYHVLPSQSATLPLEIGLLTMILLISIGHSGGIDSLLLPSLYFLLFISMFFLSTPTLILLSFLIPCFLFMLRMTPSGFESLDLNQFSLHQWTTALSFPLLLGLLLFAKGQYLEAQKEKKQLFKKQKATYHLQMFLSTFLKPKLYTLSRLVQYPQENKESIQKQLQNLIEETELMTQELDSQKTEDTEDDENNLVLDR